MAEIKCLKIFDVKLNLNFNTEYQNFISIKVSDGEKNVPRTIVPE